MTPGGGASGCRSGGRLGLRPCDRAGEAERIELGDDDLFNRIDEELAGEAPVTHTREVDRSTQSGVDGEPGDLELDLVAQGDDEVGVESVPCLSVQEREDLAEELPPETAWRTSSARMLSSTGPRGVCASSTCSARMMLTAMVSERQPILRTLRTTVSRGPTSAWSGTVWMSAAGPRAHARTRHHAGALLGMAQFIGDIGGELCEDCGRDGSPHQLWDEAREHLCADVFVDHAPAMSAQPSPARLLTVGACRKGRVGVSRSPAGGRAWPVQPMSGSHGHAS